MFLFLFGYLLGFCSNFMKMLTRQLQCSIKMQFLVSTKDLLFAYLVTIDLCDDHQFSFTESDMVKATYDATGEQVTMAKK